MILSFVGCGCALAMPRPSSVAILTELLPNLSEPKQWMFFPRSTPWPAFLEIEKGLISKHFKAFQSISKQKEINSSRGEPARPPECSGVRSVSLAAPKSGEGGSSTCRAGVRLLTSELVLYLLERSKLVRPGTRTVLCRRRPGSLFLRDES